MTSIDDGVIRAVRDVSRVLGREKDRARLMQRACDALVDTGAFSSAWTALDAGPGSPRRLAQAGQGSVSLGWLGCERRALTGDGPLVLDPARDCADCPLREAHGRQASVATLRHGGRSLGVLGVSFDQGARADEERALIGEIADDLALSLHGIDVEERHETVRDRLAGSEVRYRALFEHMLDGFAYCRMIFRDGRPDDFVYLRVNRAFEALTGLRDVEGRRVTEVMPGFRQAAPQLFEVCGSVVQSGEPARFELEFRPLETWFRVSVYRPEPGCFVAVFDDITSQKKIEAEREQLASALRQAAEPVFITDAAGTIQFVNPAFESVTGWSREDAIGKNPRILQSGLHDVSFYRAMWARLGAGEVWRGRLVNRKKDGSLITVEATISPMLDAQRRTSSYVAVQRDMTRELNLEQQVSQAQRLESVGRLAGGIAHDFNNILSVILNCTVFALEELGGDDPIRVDLEDAKRAAERAAILTRQLLAFSRRQVLMPSLVDLKSVVEGLASMLRRVLGEDVRLTLATEERSHQTLIDPGQIEQVLMNLVVNARDAMPRGGELTIRTDNLVVGEEDALDSLADPGVYARLAVTDTGCGMEEETRVRIFEPFFTTKEGGKGTGLGLSTVWGIVKQSGGHIGVKSAPARGTTFEILLPRATSTPLSVAPPSRAKPRVKGSETVLLVEDDEGVRNVTRRILEAAGYRVLTASDGADAVRISEERPDPIHLLLSDVVMPGTSGVELATRLSRTRPETRVLYMSGYTGDAIANHGVLHEGASLIDKPFSAETLTRMVRNVLDA